MTGCLIDFAATVTALGVRTDRPAVRVRVTGGIKYGHSVRVEVHAGAGELRCGAWWFHPGSSHPAEPVADQLAQNAADMLSYPEGTASPATAPHRALQMARENLDYLERLLGPQSGHDPGTTSPS